MMRRHGTFCLEEANALIPTLEHYFTQLSLLKRDLLSLHLSLVEVGAAATERGISLPRRAGREARAWREHYYHACREYDAVIEAIWDLGVEIVDLDAGVVNFFTWWDGEEVVLSWQFGEPSVQFWCDPGETFFSRRPIRQLYSDVPGARAMRH